MQGRPNPPAIRRLLGLLACSAAGILGCGDDGGTGVGGILVVATVQIDAGNRDVLVGGSRQLTATPRTSTGILVPGKSVTWSSTAGGTATVDQQGMVRGVNQGTAIIRAVVDGVTGQVSVDVRPVPVSSVTVTIGVPSLVVGEVTTVQAAAFDSIGGPLLGRTTGWSTSNATVATVSATGVVTAVGSGTVLIVATIGGQTGSVPLTVLPRSATKLGFLVPPVTTTAGVAIAPPIVVAFQDVAGSTATEAVGQVTLSFSANPTGAVLGGTLTAVAVAGVATFADVRISRSGQPYTLQATASGVTPATSPTFAIVPAAAAELALGTAPAGSAASGAPLAVQPVVELRDAFGNVAPQPGVVVTASIATGQGLLAGTLTATTAANGRATFTDLAIVGAVGSYTIRFQAPGLTEVISGPIGLGAGGATQLTFTAAPPATATNGEAFPSPVRIQLRDGTGNPVAQLGAQVTVSLASGTGILSGTLIATTGANGEATFANLILTGVVGNFVLRFASTGVTPAVSNPIALVAGAERALGIVTAPPATAVNGATLTVSPVVQLRDISGNPVLKAGVSVDVSVQSPVAGLLQGVLTRLTDSQGRATFAGLSVLGLVGPYTLTFRSGLLSDAIANPLQLLAGPAAALVFTTQPPLGAQSGVPFASQPVVQIVDQSANPVTTAGVPIAVALASGAGILGGTLVATTSAGGFATFTNLALSGPAGPHTLRFSAPGIPALVSPTITVGAGAATQVTFTTAPPATGQNGVAIAPAVVVQLRDGVGNPSPLGGVTVTATLASGPGMLGGTVTAVTNAGGSASFGNLVITGTTGAYVVSFGVPGLTPAVSNTVSLTPGVASQLTFTTAPPATATNGVDLAPAIVVQLRDLSGNAVSQAGTSVAASIFSGSGAVLSGTTPVATGAGGSATFSTLRLTGTSGNYTLRWSAAGVTPATSNAIALQSGAATALAMTTQPPPSSTSGAVLNPQPVVRLVDQSGNLVATSGITVTAALAGGPGTLGGTLTAATVSGVASFSNLAITGTTGSYTIAFSATGLAGVTSGTVGLGAGAAVALQFVGTPPTAATHGTAIAPAITVRLVDGSANPVAQAGVVVSAVRASGSGALGGTVSSATDAAGTASFANLVLTGTVGAYTIRFDVSGVTSVTTAPIALAAGAAAQLTLTTAPSSPATNGTALGTQPVVQLRDASGNAVSQAGVQITAAIIAGSGVLTGATATTNAGGTAVFAGLTITGTAGAFTLRFSSGVLTPVTATVSLQAGAATKLAILTAPGSSGTSGQLLSPQPVIQLQDQSSNAVSTGGVNVTVALGTTPGAAALGGTTTVATTANGQASFTNLSISGASGGYTLAFSSGALGGVTSGTITLSAGSATQLTFVTAPPATATNGVDLSPPIVIQARDASGNAVNQAGISVAVALATNAGGVLSGTTPVVTNGAGVATFNNLRITGTAGNYTLSFTSGGLTPALSNPIALQAGAATQLVFTTAPPTAAANGGTLAPATVVALRDQSGNAVSANGVSITADISAGAGGTLGGTLVQATTGGSASFGNLTITGLVGNYTLRFSGTGLTPVSAQVPLGLTAGPATQLGFAVIPSTSTTSGTALAVQPQIQVRDQSGNPVSHNGVLVTALVSAGGTLANATATTGSGGLAVFSGLAITGAAGNYTLTFRAPGLPDLGHGPVALSAGTATQMVFITSPPATATNGQLLSPQPVVEVRDGSGSPVLVAGTSVTVAVLSGGGIIAGTTTVQTAGNGRATFTDLALQGSPGAYVLRFSSGTLPDLDSGAITLGIGPATKLLFQSAPPATATNGQAFSSSTVVFLSDLTGNVVPTDGVSIAAAIASGPSSTLGGTTTRLTTGGVATFNDLVLTGTAGTFTLDFTSAGLTKATSNNIVVAPGAATQLAFATLAATTGNSGVALSPAPVVQLRDASGNNVPQAGVTVTAAITAPPANGAILAGGSVATDLNGQAAFSALTISGPAANYTLGFSSGVLTGLLSAPIAISAGSAVKMGFITTPSATVRNAEALAQQPVVQLLDAANNPVAVSGVAVTVAVNSGGGGLTGTLLTVATDGNGRATFAGLTITGVVGVRTLAFSGSGLTTLVSGNVDVTAGDAAALAMVAQPPGTATSGAGFGTDPSARLVDVSGNSVATAGTVVDVALLVTGGATLTGTASRATDATGLASFPGLSITGPGGSYQLRFTSTGLTGVTSSAITLTAATGLSITTQPSASVPNDVPLPQQPAIQLVDGSNAPVALAGVVVTAAIKTGQGTLMGTQTATTNASGLATFLNLKIQGQVGARTLEFTASGLTAVTSNTVTVNPGAATALAMLSQPPATANNATTLGSDPSVRLVDVSGNSVASLGTSVGVALAVPGGATLNGTTTRTTDASGVATFPGLSITGPSGSYQLKFTSTGLTEATSSAITLTAASGLSLVTQPSASVRNDIVFSQQPAVQLVDGGNAPVALAGVGITAAIKTGQGALLGTITANTNSAGLATFTDLRIQGPVGNRTIEFTSGALTPVESGAISVSAGTAKGLGLVIDVPPSVADQEVFSPAPSVRLLDISGNPVDSTGVTIQVSRSPAGATLSGTATQATVAGGSATFPGLSLSGAAGTYTLTFSGTGLTPVPSGGVTLLVPANLTVNVQPPAQGVNGVVLSPQPEVRVTDGTQAGLIGVPVTATVVVVTGPSSIVLGGTATEVTGAGGVASWTDLKLVKSGTPPGVYKLMFSTSNGLSIASSNIQIP